MFVSNQSIVIKKTVIVIYNMTKKSGLERNLM